MKIKELHKHKMLRTPLECKSAAQPARTKDSRHKHKHTYLHIYKHMCVYVLTSKVILLCRRPNSKVCCCVCNTGLLWLMKCSHKKLKDSFTPNPTADN